MSQNNGRVSSHAEAVRMLLEERKRALKTQQKTLTEPRRDSHRVEQLLAARRQGKVSVDGQGQTSESRGQHEESSGPHELLSPESSTMSFEFDKPRGRRHSSNSNVSRTLSNPGKPSSQLQQQQQQQQQKQKHQVDHVQQQRLMPEPGVAKPAATPQQQTRNYSAADVQAIAKHLPPEQQAHLLEIWGLTSASETKGSTQKPVSNQTAQNRMQNTKQQEDDDEDELDSQNDDSEDIYSSNKHSTEQHGVSLQQGSNAAVSEKPRPSLAELEQRLAAAMNSMSVATKLGPGAMHDGPFDITELWEGAGMSPEASMSQSDASNMQDLSNKHAEVSSRLKPYQYPAYQGPASVQQQQQQQQHTKRVTTYKKPAGGGILSQSQKLPARYSSGNAGNSSQPASARQQPTWGYAPLRQSSTTGSKQGAPSRPHSAPRLRAGSEEPPALSMRQREQQQQAWAAMLAGSKAEEFTFKPRINDSSREMISASYPRNLDDRIAQLSMPNTAKLQRYEQIRKECEEAEMKECTFAPRVGRPPSPVKVNREGPAHERLYNQTPRWLVKRGTILEEREKAALAECTFRPAVSAGTQRRAASAGRQRQPLHLRVPEVLRSRNESLSNARIRRELADEGASFQPRINPRSQALAARLAEEQGLAGVDVGDRLYITGLQAARAAELRDADAEECTFAPAINQRSRKLLQTSQELPGSFLERQEYLAALTAEKKALYRQAVQEAERSGPRYGSGTYSNSQSGSWSSGELQGYSSTERVAKLAYTDARRSAALKDALQQHYYSQFTFAPDINPKSRVIGKSHTIEELHQNEPGRRVRHVACQMQQQEETKECTFKPSLNPVSLQLAELRRTVNPADVSDGTAAAKEREARLQEARALSEYQQLQACTFNPEVNKSEPATRNSLDLESVPGMGRFFELQDAARRKAAQEKARQEKVWWQKPQGSSRLYTIPQPFSFESRQQQAAAEAQLRADNEARAQQQKRSGSNPRNVGRSASTGRQRPQSRQQHPGPPIYTTAPGNVQRKQVAKQDHKATIQELLAQAEQSMLYQPYQQDSARHITVPVTYAR